MSLIFNYSVRSLGAILVVAAVVGCKKEAIRDYQVAKESPAEMPETAPNLPAGHPPINGAAGLGLPPVPKLKWSTLPEGWSEKAPSSMRAASFAVSSPDGQMAELGVIPLPAGGNELDLVNMWRQQLQLPEVSQADAEREAESIDIGGGPGKLFEMVSADPLVDGKWKARLLVAMVTRNGNSWFFKMIGSDELVTAQKEGFVDFLKTVSFEDAAPMMEAEAPVVAAQSPGLPTGVGAWTPPSDWSPQTPGQMVAASFKAGEGTVSVSTFPGDVGGLLANVNRWRGQVGLGGLKEEELSQHVVSLEGGAKLVDVTGTDLASGNPKRLVGVIVPHSGQTWFYKLTGGEEAVSAQKDALVKFAQTVRYADEH